MQAGRLRYKHLQAAEDSFVRQGSEPRVPSYRLCTKSSIFSKASPMDSTHHSSGW